jgi:membrane protease YdiL (CAAX protease family)
LKDKTNFYNIIIYALLVFALSGLLVLLQSVFVNVGDYWVVFPQFAPALTVIGLFLARGHKRITFDVKHSFSINKKVLFCSISAAIFVLIVFYGFGFILSVFDKPFSQWKIPFLQWETPSLTIGFVCLLIGCIGEEIGWRGFLLPALNRNYPLIISSVFVGVLWGAWHLDFGDGVIGFFVTILFMTSLSVIISWVQTKSEGSIIPAIVIHFFVNYFARSTLFDMSLTAHFILSLLLGSFGIILFFADKKTFLSKYNVKAKT